MLAGGLGPAMAAWALKAGLMLVGLTIHDLPKLGAEPKFRATVAGFQRRWAFVEPSHTRASAEVVSCVHGSVPLQSQKRVSGGGSLENGREALSHCWPTRPGFMRSRSADGVQGGLWGAISGLAKRLCNHGRVQPTCIASYRFRPRLAVKHDWTDKHAFSGRFPCMAKWAK